MNDRLKKLVTAAVLAAITTVATMIIKIPTIGTAGYVNIGDSAVLISAWLLGNPYGALAAAVGSGLADLLSGYPLYIPGTAIIKFLMAFVCAPVCTRLGKRLPMAAAYLISSVAAEVIMVAGYFLYESIVLGYGIAASASIISNAVQAVVCTVIGNVVILLFEKKHFFGLQRY